MVKMANPWWPQLWASSMWIRWKVIRTPRCCGEYRREYPTALWEALRISSLEMKFGKSSPLWALWEWMVGNMIPLRKGGFPQGESAMKFGTHKKWRSFPRLMCMICVNQKVAQITNETKCWHHEIRNQKFIGDWTAWLSNSYMRYLKTHHSDGIIAMQRSQVPNCSLDVGSFLSQKGVPRSYRRAHSCCRTLCPWEFSECEKVTAVQEKAGVPKPQNVLDVCRKSSKCPFGPARGHCSYFWKCWASWFVRSLLQRKAGSRNNNLDAYRLIRMTGIVPSTKPVEFYRG